MRVVKTHVPEKIGVLPKEHYTGRNTISPPPNFSTFGHSSDLVFSAPDSTNMNRFPKMCVCVYHRESSETTVVISVSVVT